MGAGLPRNDLGDSRPYLPYDNWPGRSKDLCEWNVEHRLGIKSRSPGPGLDKPGLKSDLCALDFSNARLVLCFDVTKPMERCSRRGASSMGPQMNRRDVMKKEIEEVRSRGSCARHTT